MTITATLDHVKDHTASYHEYMLDELGFAFCHEAYQMYYDDTKELPEVASILGQTVEDVNHGINAFEHYISS